MLTRQRTDDRPAPGGIKPTDRRKCTGCGRTKPLSAFTPIARPPGHHSWCRTCVRVAVNNWHTTEEYREQQRAYFARPEVRARRKAQEARRREARKAEQRAYRQSPRGKILHCRQTARARLRLAVEAGNARRADRLAALIASYDRELARLDASYDGRCRPRSA